MNGDSHFDSELGEGGRRFYAPLVGTVVDNKDPEQLGRVRFRVPGIFDPSSPWARPMGIGGGALDRGFFFTPIIGAEIVVFFHGGDPADPLFMTAQWGKPDGENEVPEEAQKDNPTSAVIATPGFRIELDETEGSRKLRIICVPSGDVIQIDAETSQIRIKATTKIELIADGEISLDALSITIGGRPVTMGIEDPI